MRSRPRSPTGAIPADKVGETWSQVIAFRIDAGLALLFATLLWVVIIDMLRTALRVVSGQPVLPLAESKYQPTQLTAGMVTSALH